MAKKIVLLLADGFEDVEAVTPIDYLRRAGVEVTVGVGGGKPRTVKSSHSLTVQADTTLAELAREGKLRSDQWDGVIIPGHARGDERGRFCYRRDVDKGFSGREKWIGAIAPPRRWSWGPWGFCRVAALPVTRGWKRRQWSLLGRGKGSGRRGRNHNHQPRPGDRGRMGQGNDRPACGYGDG